MKKPAQNFFPKIIPAILETDFSEVEKKLEILAGAGDISLIQIDLADGKLVDGKTFLEPEKLEKFTNQYFELDLMVEDPLVFVKKAIPNVCKVCAHIESEHVAEFLAAARELGYVAGVAINPDTSLATLDSIVDKAEFVQFLGIHPGGQGRHFISSVLGKIADFKRRYPKIPVQVDGGVNDQNIMQLLQLGVNSVVIGSAIVRSKNPHEEYLKLQTMTAQTQNKISENINSLSDVKVKKIAFLGGAAWQPTDQPYKDAFEVAKVLAENGYGIVNGGGPGVMEAATKGAHAAGTRALAITYHPNKPKRHYEGVGKENDFDEEILTLDYFDRTKVMLQNTDVHIVFKGSIGTLSEFGMTWVSSWIHEPNSKPIVLYGEFWNDILNALQKGMLIEPEERDILKVCCTPQEVLEFVEGL